MLRCIDTLAEVIVIMKRAILRSDHSHWLPATYTPNSRLLLLKINKNLTGLTCMWKQTAGCAKLLLLVSIIMGLHCTETEMSELIIMEQSCTQHQLSTIINLRNVRTWRYK